MAYFIDYCMHNEPLMLRVFQKFYQLKVIRCGVSTGNAYFSTCSGCVPIVQNNISNLR